MDVERSLDWPGAVDEEAALMASVSFDLRVASERIMEGMFFDSLERTKAQFFVEKTQEISTFLVQGDWNEVRVTNFAMGRDNRPRKPKPFVGSAVTVITSDEYL